MNTVSDDYYKAKYETLVNAILNVARVSAHTGTLYTVNDEHIYEVLEDMEPERVEAKRKELEL